MMNETPMTAHRVQGELAIFTIGHSTRSLDEFIRLLRLNKIEGVIDIRRIPKSRRQPQFACAALGTALRRAAIGYTHLESLGGFRRARPDSANLGWRNRSFRGFADYMETPEFEAGLARAVKLAEAKPSALMCAEAVPWRCHRSLVADALLVRGLQVEEIVSGSRPKRHKLTPFAQVDGTKITYPGNQPILPYLPRV
jgi:uncharacterized protein (DUF488 family)